MSIEAESIRLLAEEYMYLQQTIEKFDARALQIKEWGTGISIAIIAFALKLPNRWLVCLAAVNALCFWVIEATWKLFQWSYMGRIWEIEKHFRTVYQDHELPPLQITQYWLSQWRGGELLEEFNWKRDKVEVYFEKLFDWNVMLPYLLIVILVGFIYMFWNRFGFKQAD